MNKKRILIVEDSDQIRNSWLNYLEKQIDAKFDDTGSGVEALEFIKNNHYDLLICDLKMPIVDGIDVVKELKEKNPQSKAMIITSWESDHVEKDVESVGAEYIKKSIELKDLKLIVERNLND